MSTTEADEAATPAPAKKAAKKRPPAPKPETRRQNHGNGHSYFLDGTKVLGVTTMINQGHPKPALINWAAGTVAEWVADRIAVLPDGTIDASRLVKDVQALAAEQKGKAMVGWSPTLAAFAMKSLPNRDRDAAANKGTKVHKIAEQLAAGAEILVPPEIDGHVRSYVSFLTWLLDEADGDIVAVEGVIISRRRRYMGTFDLLVWIDGKLWLVDIKTSRSGIFPETALQLAGYRFGETYLDDDGVEHDMPELSTWEDDDGNELPCTAGLWIRADGWDFIPVVANEDAHRQLLYARETAKFMDAERGTWVRDALYRGTV